MLFRFIFYTIIIYLIILLIRKLFKISIDRNIRKLQEKFQQNSKNKGSKEKKASPKWDAETIDYEVVESKEDKNEK